MQAIVPVTVAELIGPVQRMRYKLEIYDDIHYRADFLTGWSYRKRLDIQTAHLDANLADFPLYVPVVADADIGAACRADGYDIRFTAADGVTELDYERELGFIVAGGLATGNFWVKTSLATAGTHIWLYYGNVAASDGADPENAWDADFKAVYHMNDATTSTILDSTGNDNDGAKKGANEPVEDTGKIGRCQKFDGANDFIDCGDNGTLDFGVGDFSISAWIKMPTTDTDSRRIINKRDPSNIGWEVYVEGGSNKLNALIGDGATLVNGEPGGALNVIRDNLWHHFCVAFDRSGSAVFYIAGVAIGTLAIAPASGSVSNIENLSLGRYGSAYPDLFFKDYMDEVRISSVARSAEWIKFEYRNMAEADNELTWGAEVSSILTPAEWVDLSLLGGSGGGDYLKGISLSLGGAGMQTAPIAGTWSATIDNPLGIFHPQHPTSAYADLLRIGREVRISIGGNYGGVDYYWQRLIGFMDAPRFDHGSHTVEIGGMDYMKLLADTELRSPDNYWGSDICIPTIATVQTLGAEIYAEGDAMDIAADAANVAGWTILTNAVFADVAPGSAPSTNVGKLERDVAGVPPSVANDNVGAFTAGSNYVVTFKYKRKTGSTAGELTCGLYESGTWTLWGQLSGLTSMSWTTASFQFTAGATANGRMKFTLNTLGDPLTYFYIDEISIKENTGTGWNATYELPSDSCGPYYVTLEQQSGSGSGCVGSGANGTPMWFADGLNGWYYDEATKVISFNSERVVDDNDSLLVYYYTTQVPENVVADLMVTAGLYATRVAALADMDYTATGITIDRVWFDAGTTCLAAIQKMCERLDYRFWFAYDGQPHFHPAPVAGAVDFDFPDAGDLMGIADFQDISMVRNYIVIEGIEQAMYADTEKTQKSRFVGTESDAVSIAAYLEKTYAITNNLFQDQASVDAACVSVLAAYKDPAWYADLQLAFNPVPLELGDTISWVLELEPTDEVGGSGSLEVAMTGIIRDIKINDGISNYKVEVSEVGSGS